MGYIFLAIVMSKIWFRQHSPVVHGINFYDYFSLSIFFNSVNGYRRTGGVLEVEERLLINRCQVLNCLLTFYFSILNFLLPLNGGWGFIGDVVAYP